jgi:hypothetical protein
MTKFNNSEDAFLHFQLIVKSYQSKSESLSSSNEANTRLIIINEILNLLGWDNDSFNPEYWIPKAGYSDYLLKSNGTPRLVVEAKRLGDTFKSSSKKLGKTNYEVRYLRKAFKSSFSEVIEQARSYCSETKVPYALLTNGAEWVVLQLINAPGVSADSAKGVYFGNIFSDNFEFDLLWDLLSRQSFETFELEEYLSNINYKPSEVCKILQSDYSSLQWRVAKSEDYLKEFYDNFFSKIIDTNQRKMLEYCFVSDSKLDQYRGELKRLLKDNKPIFLPNDTYDLEPGESKDTILNDEKTGQVVIITGSVGCGKSTLVTKCLVEARQQKGLLAKTILIDLINEVTRSNPNAKSLIFNEIFQFLRNEFSEIFELAFLRKIFSKEIKELRESSYKEFFDQSPNEFIKYEADLLASKNTDIENFVYCALKQLTSENNSVTIIFDNVDRAHEKFQEEMYSLAHRISEKTGAKTIITLREFTFFKNKNDGFLDVRSEDTVIHLKAPNFGKLISKRIKYIETRLKEDYRNKEWRRIYPDFDEFIYAIKKHAATIKNSIQISQDGHNILETLSSISWHNIRYFYALLYRVHTQLGSSENNWMNEEVIAALMTTTEADELPVLPNIFVPFSNVNQAYFLKLRMISFLAILKSGEILNGIPTNRIVEFLKLYGYQRRWILSSIEECVTQRLIECLEIPSENESVKSFKLSKEGTFRISPLGLLYLTQVIKNKTYRSLISVNLPIHSISDFDTLRYEYEELISYMSDETESCLFKEGLEIVLSSGLANMTENYLSKEFKKERVVSDAFLNHSELQLTERKLEETFSILEPQPANLPSMEDVYIGSSQLSLSLEPQNKERTNQLSQPIQEIDHREFVKSLDYVFDECIFEGTEFIPLIFCAIRLKCMEKVDYCSGSELTKVINEYLVSDENKKLPNNVSRALRSEKLISQDWLDIRTDMHPKNKMFGLTEGWHTHWCEIFDTP